MQSDPLTLLIQEALSLGASDIHFEPGQSYTQVRFRVDGLMHSHEVLPKSTYAAWLVRLKTLANLDIAQSLRPQDGRFSFETQARHHFRLHTCPTLFGEKMVMRLLPESQRMITLEALGLHPGQYHALLQTLKKRSGLIIVTGPTGSGKTMTLYACLTWLKTQPLQITTLEDPVEMPLAGTTQIAIQDKQGLTFASALRAVLRQDPDVIFIGEMRDFDTADIAIRAALTGHLVLTTLHTPNALAAIKRLENMHIPAYHLSDSLSLIISQRLVRRCQGPDHFQGRIGMFELLHPSHTFVDGLTLPDAGQLHVQSGLTTWPEVERVL